MKFSIIIPSRNEKKVNEVALKCSILYPEAQIIISHDTKGIGKGWAIRNGLKQAIYNVVCFIDGDMDIHPRMIKRLIPFLEDYDIVVGKKDIAGIPQRRIITWMSRIFIRLLFNLNVDTQTGIKLFKTCTLKEWETNGFAFDIEVLYKANQLGYKMIEVPIEAKIVKKMSLHSIVRTFIEAIKIRYAVRCHI